MHPVYSKRDIVYNFNIKLNQPPVYMGIHRIAPRVSTSLGVSGFYKFIRNRQLADKMITKAMESQTDKIEFPLRRGGMIRFYVR